MSNIQTKKQGSIVLVVLFIVLVLVLGIGGLMFLKKARITENSLPGSANKNVVSQTPEPTVSSSTDLKVMNKELNDTTITSVDGDFKDMNASASAL